MRIGVRGGAHLQKTGGLARTAQIFNGLRHKTVIVGPDKSLAQPGKVTVEKHGRDITAEGFYGTSVGTATKWSKQNTRRLKRPEALKNVNFLCGFTVRIEQGR